MSTSVSKRESFWRHVIAQREALKLTINEACQRAGVSQASFYLWQKRLRKADRKAKPNAESLSSLMPVRIVDNRAAEITLELPGDIRLRVPSGCDEATLQCVVRTVLASSREQA